MIGGGSLWKCPGGTARFGSPQWPALQYVEGTCPNSWVLPRIQGCGQVPMVSSLDSKGIVPKTGLVAPSTQAGSKTSRAAALADASAGRALASASPPAHPISPVGLLLAVTPPLDLPVPSPFNLTAPSGPSWRQEPGAPGGSRGPCPACASLQPSRSTS